MSYNSAFESALILIAFAIYLLS